MRAFAGQAARRLAWIAHHLAQIVLALVVALGIALGAAAWRLSQGPLDIGWLAAVLEHEANAEDTTTRLTIGRAGLAWEGFRKGVDRPLDFRLTEIDVTDADGHRRMHIPRAEMSVCIVGLLLGRLVPRAIAIDGARLHADRGADGSLTLDIGDLGGADATDAHPPSHTSVADTWTALMHELSLPPQGDAGASRSQWSQLRRVLIRDAAMSVSDRKLGLEWRAPRLDIDLQRVPQGGVDGSARLELAVGDQQAILDMQSHLRPDGGTELQAQLSPIQPAAVAAASPSLAQLSALDAPVTLSATATLAADLALNDLHLQTHVGGGSASLGSGILPFAGADISAELTPNLLNVTLQRLELAAHPSGPPTTVTGQIKAHRDPTGIVADVSVDLDQGAFADLPSLWPVGVGGKGTRPWIGGNITSGIARNGHVEAALRIDNDLSDAQLTAISGGIDGHDLTVAWLRPVPPVEHGEAHLTFLSPDEIDIALTAGVQDGGSQGGVSLHGGKIRITGLLAHHQFIDIDADLAGPLADLLTTLRHPRLKLLATHPIEMRNPAGQFTGHLAITKLPLEDNVTVDDLKLHAKAHITDVHLGGIAGGRDLDHGTIDLDASNDGLTAQGPAQLAGIPATLRVDMDFRSGPPSQVLQKVSVTGTLEPAQLADHGIPSYGVFAGAAAVTATLQERRDGSGDIVASADLARSTLNLAPLAYTKPSGHPATAQLHVTLNHDHLVSIDKLTASGDGLDIVASLDFNDGHPASAHLQRLMLGKATDLHGDISWPSHISGWSVTLAGASLDLSSEFTSGPFKADDAKPKSKPADDATLPTGAVDIHLDRLQVGNGRAIEGLMLRGHADANTIREAQLTGRVAAMPFAFAISPTPTGRTLSGNVSDIGELLKAMAVSKDVEGGRLSLTGAYDERAGGKTLSGRAEIGPFRLRGAPTTAKILQGLTLYGLVDALRGPGLGVDQLVAPFKLTGNTLDLIDARAFSSSLGATVKGTVDLDATRCELQGTIVPLYFFNSLPGKIPLIGKLFSPESGGGLFAATFGLHGPCDDPSIGVNPLATLTPGFLRGLFSIFDGGQK